MKVHLSASLQDIDKHLDTYTLIEGIIKANGHEVAREWLNEYRDGKKGDFEQFTNAEWKKIADDTLVAVEAADAVIVEASIPSFSLGYISALTLTKKKPLLVLFNTRSQPYILDANNSLKRAEVYHSQDELRQTISSFLKDTDVDVNNLRFNMTLDRELYNYLNWEAVSTGKTKAKIIREILKDRIKRKQ